MKFRTLEDPFKYMQPKMTFTEDLAKPLHTEMPPRWNTSKLNADEVDFSSINLDIKFRD